ncbi:MAG: LmeA family phospholipid-binding protein [Mycobacterium sp.]|uniref:LmeA family phospholipid-binding protein n=1 Tax=Mycobacterium sp. TaxID=1785 RepID=UPI003C4A69F2
MTNPQGPPHQDPSMWARPGSQSPPTEPAPQDESPTTQVAAHEPPAEQAHQTVPPTLEFPADSPYEQPPSQDPTTPVKTKRRFFADPVSIILVLVIVVALAVAGLIGGELYARNRANNVVAAATECVVQDQAKVSFGPTPFLLQHVTGHYRDISIRTAGHQIRDAKGMTADININDVDLHGSGDSKGTIGALDATITWTSDGIKQTLQNGVPFVGGLINSVNTDTSAGTVELNGALGLGSVTVKPSVAGSGLSLQVVKVTAMGATLPHETAQSALDTFTSGLTKGYPLGIHADSVHVTNDGVVAHFSTRNASIPASHTDPCFAHV